MNYAIESLKTLLTTKQSHLEHTLSSSKLKQLEEEIKQIKGAIVVLKSTEDVNTLNTMESMCVESLDPDTFIGWQSVRNQLMSNRKAFK